MKIGLIGSGIIALSLVAGYTSKQDPSASQAARPDLHGKLAALIVGGGPDKQENQAGIESNVRYVNMLLPSSSARRVLFADGNKSSRSVYCENTNSQYFREPHLDQIDGPSTNNAVHAEISTLSKTLEKNPGLPALLFFTGHGGGDTEGDYKDNFFCTWKDDQLSVTDLAKRITTIPKTSPIVLVMVECYSGGFGNLLFDKGSPAGNLIDRPICGFFAATAYRMSAGCTPEVNESNYRDFTGYFFAALTGVDRMGHKVTGADYDNDGHVTMDEAYAYTLIHDESIDTPVCTSDVFLRKYVTVPESECFKKPYAEVLSWATPAQRAALEALRSTLGIGDEGDMRKAYAEFQGDSPDGEDARTVHVIRLCRLYKTVVLTHALLNSNDERVKTRFKALIAQEHSNPLDDPSLLMARR